ncbi:MAG: tetratricopeptide repeat protein [Cytophagales bacterium]|nr:MAG: tetratricopeptide repeat protein [Cytophagales bacterium]
MQKSKIIIIIAALALGIYIFTLPKGVIKKEEANVSANRDTKPIPKNNTMEKTHSVKTSDKENNNLKLLTKNYNTVSNPEKKIIFADSLANKYRKLHLYDSATKYIEIIANAKANTEAYSIAGDFNFEAYSFSDKEDRNKFNEKARRFYNKALEITPKDYEVKCKLAMTFVGGENPMEGIGILKEVLKEDPKNETAMYQLGILSLQSGQNSKAVDRFNELIKINPKNANAHYYLGVSFANLGEINKAKASLEKAKALEEDKGFRAAVDDYLKELNSQELISK